VSPGIRQLIDVPVTPSIKVTIGRSYFASVGSSIPRPGGGISETIARFTILNGLSTFGSRFDAHASLLAILRSNHAMTE
jgi:hypothetical protein